MEYDRIYEDLWHNLGQYWENSSEKKQQEMGIWTKIGNEPGKWWIDGMFIFIGIMCNILLAKLD